LETDASPSLLRFGEFVIDLQSYALRDANGPIELERRAFDVLCHLIEHRDRVVSKDALLDEIWSDQIVGESTLTRIISLLRRALRDTVGESRYLKTVRGRGYRFVAPISEMGRPPSAPQRRTPERAPGGLVGRTRELELAQAGLEQALGGRLRVLWLEGPAGIGKSRLGVALSDRAREHGARVAAARCDSSSGVPPFWPWIQLLRVLLDELDPDARAQLIEPVRSDLHALLPEDVGGSREAESTLYHDAEESRFHLFDGLIRLLRSLARSSPLMLWLDDLHQMDTPSFRLLEFAAKHLGDAAVFVLGSFREPRSADDTLLAEVRRAIGPSSATDLVLGPLTVRDAVPFLLEHTGLEVPEAVARALFERAAGNPLFLRHLAGSLVSRGNASEWPRLLQQLPAPKTVLDAVRQDVDRLSESCIQMLRCASVIGRAFALGLLRQVLPPAEDSLLQKLEEASEAHVVELVEVELDGFRFVHPLIHESLYASLSSEQCARLHLRVAEVLEAASGDAARIPRLAHHYWCARLLAAPERVRAAQLEAAQDALRALSFEEASRLGQRALELAAPWPSVDAQIDALLLISEASHARGEDQGMREWCFRAARLARKAGRYDLLARAALGFVGIGGLGRLDAAWVSLAEESLQCLGTGSPELRVRLMIQLALEYYWAGYSQRGLSLSAEAERMARTLDDPGTVAAVLELRLSLARDPDDLEAADARVDEILSILPAQARPEIALRSLLVRHDLLLEQERLSEAEIEARRVIHLAEELRLLWPLRVRLLYDLLDGRHSEVDRFLASAIQNGRIDFATSGEWAQHFMAVFYHLRLQQERLPELIPILSEWAARFPAFLGVRVGLAHAHSKAGQDESARELVAQLARNDFEDFPRDQIWLWLMVSLAEVLLAVGTPVQLERVRRLLWPYRRRIAVLSADACLGSVSRVLGVISHRLGRIDTGLRALEYARRVDAKLGDFVYARTSIDLCHVYTARGGAGARQQVRQIAVDVARRAERDDLAPWARRARELMAES